ncbi:MAG: ISNCY family transposase [Thiomicrorhabdus sp.]|nr:ISNCY family transposase [Thiomicrorhabdus sp.]
MRRVKNPQLHFGEVNIAEIEFDARSRDDIPAVLKGLQYIYTNDDARKKVFSTLAATLDPSVSPEVGRPGMELWEIFVLATLKLGLNCDFDRLQELANHHNTVRQMLGHSGWEDTASYKLQTIIDNVSKLKPSVLADINQVIVESGHEVAKKKPGETLRTRCDSLVVETDVHYPTDISLLWDAMRKVIELTGKSCESENLSDWRQHRFNLKQLKKRYRKAQKIKYSTSKDEAKKAVRSEAVHQAYRNYLLEAECLIEKIDHTIMKLARLGKVFEVEKIEYYIKHAERQVDQIDRRVLKEETIPHSEKVFSIFEEHTEWVCKGKAGVPVELGVRVSVIEDQYQFVLHHRIMWQETDDKAAVPFIEEAKQRYPEINQCSFDKGYYSKDNVIELNKHLENVILPKKGRCNKEEKAWQESEIFGEARRKHSGVEACINNLEVRGLNRCLSYGRDGFERHVALSIVATNLHRIGLLLQRKELVLLRREEQRRSRRLAA